MRPFKWQLRSLEIFLVYKMSLFLLLASATLYLVSCQSVTITTSFEGNYVCPGKEIVFTCKTNGSVIAWISNEYIGIDGNQLELASMYTVGHTVTSTINSKTFANLTMIKGDQVIESQLHIMVSKDFPTANITCSDVSHGSSSSVRFELSSLPNEPQDVTAFEITPPPGDNCIILVNWMPPNNTNTSLVKQYKLESPAGNFITKTPRTKIAVALLAHHCENGSNARISIHAIDSCGRNGASSNDSIVTVTEVLDSSIITTQHSIFTPGGLGDQHVLPEEESKSAVAIVGVVLGVIIFILVAFIIVLGIALRVVSNRMRHLKRQLVTEEVPTGSKKIDTESHIASDSSSTAKDSDHKDIKLIPMKSLDNDIITSRSHVDDDDDDDTTEFRPRDRLLPRQPTV